MKTFKEFMTEVNKVKNGKVESKGKTEYYKDGKLHREDGPAVIKGKIQEWWLNGVRHREDGPAATQGSFEEWFLNGKYHRVGGPAIIEGKYQAWYQNNKMHREDGPAVIDGTRHGWYLNGVKYEEKDYWKKVNKPKEMTITYLTGYLGRNPKEMTQAEIEKAIGHKVKIVAKVTDYRFKV